MYLHARCSLLAATSNAARIAAPLLQVLPLAGSLGRKLSDAPETFARMAAPGPSRDGIGYGHGLDSQVVAGRRLVGHRC